MILLEKQQSLLKELLDFSQRQFAETDPVGLDDHLSQKDKCIEELHKGCIVFDMHSYNYVRHNKELPVFNIGSENIDNDLEKVDNTDENKIEDEEKIDG